MYICGSSPSLPVPVSILLDVVRGSHALLVAGGCVQSGGQKVVVLPTAGIW